MTTRDFTNRESASQSDPLILRFLQKKYEKQNKKEEIPAVQGRQMGAYYAALLGVGAMLLVILLGILRGTDVDLILVTSSRTLLVFSVIGFIAGKIAEMCVRESAKSMIRDMLRRSGQMQNEE